MVLTDRAKFLCERRWLGAGPLEMEARELEAYQSANSHLENSQTISRSLCRLSGMKLEVWISADNPKFARCVGRISLVTYGQCNQLKLWVRVLSDSIMQNQLWMKYANQYGHNIGWENALSERCQFHRLSPIMRKLKKKKAFISCYCCER